VGKARVFDTEDDFVHAVESGSIKKGEKTVVILRYLGPQGGPGEFCLSNMIPFVGPPGPHMWRSHSRGGSFALA